MQRQDMTPSSLALPADPEYGLSHFIDDTRSARQPYMILQDQLFTQLLHNNILVHVEC